MGIQSQDRVGSNQGNITLQGMQEVAEDTATELQAEKVSSQRTFMEGLEEMVNPAAAARVTARQKPIKARVPKTEKAKEAAQERRLIPVEAMKEAATRFQQRSRGELDPKLLLLLREYIKDQDTPEEILQKLQEMFADADPALLDEALNFLMETTQGELQDKVKEAKELLHQRFGRAVDAGRNIGEAAATAADQGLGSPTEMRGLYKEITENLRDAATLFEELSKKWPYDELKKVIKFLFTSLGGDLRSEGPSIPRGLLHNLLNEARALQAILGVYAFFKGRMGLMGKMFKQQGIPMPSQLGFEEMAKQFMALVNDRYPSEEKLLNTAKRLGVDQWIRAKIIVLMQLRDAVREVARERIYRSLQDRDKLYEAIILTLENLEDELQELEELEAEGSISAPELEVEVSRQEAREGDLITFQAHVTGGSQPYTYYWQWADSPTWQMGPPVQTCQMPGGYSAFIPMMAMIRDDQERSSKTVIVKIKRLL